MRILGSERKKSNLSLLVLTCPIIISIKINAYSFTHLTENPNFLGRFSLFISELLFDNVLHQTVLLSTSMDQIDVDQLANSIINDNAYAEPPEVPYQKKLKLLAENYRNDIKIISQVGLNCFSCEFNAGGKVQKSGFKECWSHFYNWTEEQYRNPKITEIWNFRRKSQLFYEGIIFMEDVLPEHIGNVQLKTDGTLSAKERQWMQVEKTQNNDDTFYFDADGFKDAIKHYTYPLHFIDFETSMVAIPFYKGQRPYEQIAFQFSHHIIRKDGSIEHIGQFIETEKGKFLILILSGH